MSNVITDFDDGCLVTDGNGNFAVVKTDCNGTYYANRDPELLDDDEKESAEVVCDFDEDHLSA